MQFLIVNTDNYCYTLDEKYYEKIKANNFKIEPFAQKTTMLDRDFIYTIEIDSLEDLLRLKDVVDCELIIANTYDFDEIKIPQIEIYDNYRE